MLLVGVLGGGVMLVLLVGGGDAGAVVGGWGDSNIQIPFRMLTAYNTTVCFLVDEQQRC